MELRLEKTERSGNSTIGEQSVDGQFECCACLAKDEASILVVYGYPAQNLQPLYSLYATFDNSS